MRLSNYTDQEVLHKTDRSLVLRGVRTSDKTKVIIKTHSDLHSTRERLAQLKREYELLRLLQGVQGVIQTYGLEPEDDRFVLLMEDFGGDSLVQWMRRRPFSLAEGLTLGVKICATLQEIHGRRIIHKDLNPSNLIYNPKTGELKVIDFHIASIVQREDCLPSNPYVLEGTLEYISPEQTGRMNRALDYRTDFYSLGVTLYELFTGRRPFDAQDPLELVHCHLAKQPPPLDAVQKEIPEVVSNIVMKLLAKTPERRYRSALGIREDLQRCLAACARSDPIPDFPIGQKDFAEALQIPQQLFGRAKEIEWLLSAFEKTCQGDKQILLVSGPSGIGKTSLVLEVHKPLTKKRGYFISGKFEQLQRMHPYLAFAQAFRELSRQLLTEPEGRIQQWKAELLLALGQNAPIIVELIPEMGLLLGPQPALPEMSAQEKQNRFIRTFLSFLGVLAQPTHPLALFIDDLQWADLASLELLRKVLASPVSTYVFFIGAYRDNEVSPAHPFALVLAELAEEGVRPTMMPLPPLGVENINELLTKTLSCPGDTSLELAALIHGKTQGNPFFINEFVMSLAKDQLLVFDTQRLEWKWEIERIRAQDITDNVIGLLTASLKKLPGETQRALRLAACLGNRFELDLLGKVCGSSGREVLRCLTEAISLGYVIPLGQEYQSILLNAAGEEAMKVFFKFSHDRIQQAAYQLNPEAELPGIHRKAGEALREALSAVGDEARIFELVHHLNLARSKLEDQQEADELARLNWLAGRRARESSAFKSAYQYLRTGIELLGPEGFHRHYQLALSLHEGAAEMACVCGQFDQLKELAAIVNAQAKTVLETVNVEEVKLIAEIMQNNTRAGASVGIAMLRRLGLRIPENPSILHVIWTIFRVIWAMRGRTTADLLAQEEMTDPTYIATMRILSRLLTSTFFSSPHLLLTTVTSSALLSIKHGSHGASGPAYAAYGALLCDVLGNVPKGHPFGDLAIRLIAKLGDTRYKSQTYFMTSTFLMHWAAPLRETLPLQLEGYQSGLESGEYEMAAYCLAKYCIHLFFHGIDLELVNAECARYEKPLRELNHDIGTGMLLPFWQGALNFRGDSPEPWVLKGEKADESALLPLYERVHNHTLMVCNLFPAGMLCLYFGKYDEAISRFDKILKISDSIYGLFGATRVHFYSVLSRLAAWERLSRLSRVRQWRIIIPSLHRMRRYARNAPENHLHLFYLVQAELCRIRKRFAKAIHLYRLAAETAQKNGFLHERALALERLARYLFAQDLPLLADPMLEEATAAYLHWGALAKVRKLEEEYSQLRSTQRSKPTHTSSRLKLGVPNLTPTSLGGAQVDVISVAKASQSISEELVLSKLLKRLLQILVQNTGAESGYLALKDKQGKLYLESHTSIIAGAEESFAPALVENCPTIPQGVIRYVERSQEVVALGDAANEGSFVQDPCIQRLRPKSILCMPVCRAGEMKAVLYLENASTSDVFSSDRVEIVKLLLSQAAISIDNARLYDELVESKLLVEESLKKANESDRAKGEFLARTSHELRTPLNSIINFPKALLEHFHPIAAVRCSKCKTMFALEPGEVLDESQACPDCDQPAALVPETNYEFEGPLSDIHQALQIVHRSGDQLLSVVNDILDISKLKEDKAVLRPERIDMHSLLQEVLDSIASQATQRGIEIDRSRRDDRIIVEGDRVKLGQVIFNLVGNAIKFSDTGGRIAIDLSSDDEGVVLSVRDRGIGIAKEHQQKIFDSFYQVESGATRRAGGTGLGLAISKMLTELHGGRIWVESEPGKGSTFFVHLPRALPKDAPFVASWDKSV